MPIRNRLALLILLILCTAPVGGVEGELYASLSTAEKAWLADHPVVRFVSDPNYAPIEFLDAEGRHVGIGADYLRLVGARLGVDFTLVPVKDWNDALAKVRNHDADMLAVAADTDLRREYLSFTTPHIIIPAVIITARPDLDAIPLAEMARTLTVAVVGGGFSEERVLTLNPNADVVTTPDIQTALQTVSFGLADVMLGDLFTASYFIGQNNITNLRVVLQVEPTIALSMGVRKDWPMLRNLLDKALASLTEAEKQTIKDDWVRLTPMSWWRNPTYRTAALTVLTALLAIIVTTLAWNRILAHQVRARTEALEDAHLQLIQAAKLESIGRLAAGVAHEVKNPLAILQMGMDYLAADLPQDSDARPVIADMEDAIQRADTVVKGLLDFSRDRKLDTHPTDLNEVLRDSLKLVRHELTQHNIAVTEALAPKLPAIHADPNKLKQVFINLFMNAVQAMGHNGQLMVSSKLGRVRQFADLPANAKARFAAGERVIRIDVQDTGPGVDPAKLATVFDPFVTTKPVGQGTGLGLSVSRTIVDLHEGTISLRNRDGGGASLVLIFKARKEPKS
jgi:signal transduction histidine kinase